MSDDKIRRVVTGHDAEGRAVVVSDGPLESVPNPTGASHVTAVWSSSVTPADNDDPTDGRDRALAPLAPGGSVIRVLDLLPGKGIATHRTDTLDYGIIVAGVIEMMLDDDVVTRLESGDVVVQRGTIHSWRNPSSDTTARVVFVMLDALPATVDGTALPSFRPGTVPPVR